jgi:hypothetical protein
MVRGNELLFFFFHFREIVLDFFTLLSMPIFLYSDVRDKSNYAMMACIYISDWNEWVSFHNPLFSLLSILTSIIFVACKWRGFYKYWINFCRNESASL